MDSKNVNVSYGPTHKTLLQQIDNHGKASIIMPPDAPTSFDCKLIVTGGGSTAVLTPSTKFRITAPATASAGSNPDCRFERPGYNAQNDNAPAVAGSEYLVQWTFDSASVAAGPYSHIQLDLVSRNRPSAASTVALNGGTPMVNTGVFQWSVPGATTVIPDDRYALRLTPCSSDGETTLASGVVESAEFSILAPKPTLGEGLSMSGSQTALTKGDTDVISWSSAGLVGNVKLRLFECHDTLCDDMEFVQTLPGAESVPAMDNSFSWKIPFTSPPLAGVRYKVRATSQILPHDVFADSPIITISDFSCSLGTQVQCGDERTFSVTAPAAGTIAEAGRALEIKWTVAGRNKVADWTEQAVTIQLMSGGSSPGEGQVVRQIAAQAPNTGHYTWYPPLGDLELLGSRFSIGVFPIDRRISDASAGIAHFRSACPAESLKSSKCRSGIFSIEHKEAAPMRVTITDVHTSLADPGDPEDLEWSPSASNSGGDAARTSVSSFVVGKSYPVVWESVQGSLSSAVTSAPPGTYTVSLALIGMSDSTSTTFASGLPLSGSHFLVIPAATKPSYPSASFLIKATVLLSSDGTVEGTSASTDAFRISAAETITVDAPTGVGKTLVKGSTYNVQWTYTGVPFDADIFLYRGARGSDRRTMNANSTSDVRCTFPFLYHGRMITAADGCISGETSSSHFGGRPWCATAVDDDKNPTSRSACAPLTLVNTVAGRGGLVAEGSLQPVDIDERLYRYTPSSANLPGAGPEFHLVLSSRKDRSVIAYSSPFALECTHYKIFLTLKSGISMPSVSRVVADAASLLAFPESKITSVKERGDTADNQVEIEMTLAGSIAATCPIEAFDRLLDLWANGGVNSGVLSDMDLSVKPSKERIDFSEEPPTTPGEEEGVDYVLMISLIIVGLCVFSSVRVFSMSSYFFFFSAFHILQFPQSIHCRVVSYFHCFGVDAYVHSDVHLSLYPIPPKPHTPPLRSQMVIAGVYVWRHREHHEMVHKHVASLHRDWREAKTKSRRTYYFNTRTGESRWTRPEGEAAIAQPASMVLASAIHLPPGWHPSEHEGQAFYWHDDGESTSWEVPDWIPEGWVPPEEFFQNHQYELAHAGHQPEVFDTARTNTHGGHHRRGVTTQIVDNAGQEWLVAEADQGTRYFFNQDTGESTWERPHGQAIYGTAGGPTAWESNPDRHA